VKSDFFQVSRPFGHKSMGIIEGKKEKAQMIEKLITWPLCLEPWPKGLFNHWAIQSK
jgi:hypothetical protein